MGLFVLWAFLFCGPLTRVLFGFFLRVFIYGFWFCGPLTRVLFDFF